jgi:hypothetical protein
LQRIGTHRQCPRGQHIETPGTHGLSSHYEYWTHARSDERAQGRLNPGPDVAEIACGAYANLGVLENLAILVPEYARLKEEDLFAMIRRKQWVGQSAPGFETMGRQVGKPESVGEVSRMVKRDSILRRITTGTRNS